MGSSDRKWPSGILSPWWSCAFTVEMNPNANAESATLLSEPSLAENVVIFARPFESLRIGGTNDSTVGGESDFSAHRRIPRSCRNSKFQVVRAPRHLSTVQTYSASRPSKPVSISIAYVTTVQSPPRQAPHPHQPGPCPLSLLVPGPLSLAPASKPSLPSPSPSRVFSIVAMGLKEGVQEILDSEDEHEPLSSSPSPCLGAQTEVELGVSQASQDGSQGCAGCAGRGLGVPQDFEFQSLGAANVLDQTAVDGQTNLQGANKGSMQQGEGEVPASPKDSKDTVPVKREQDCDVNSMPGVPKDDSATRETQSEEGEDTVQNVADPKSSAYPATTSTNSPTSENEVADTSEHLEAPDKPAHPEIAISSTTTDVQPGSVLEQHDSLAAGLTEERKPTAEELPPSSAATSAFVPERDEELKALNDNEQLQGVPTVASPTIITDGHVAEGANEADSAPQVETSKTCDTGAAASQPEAISSARDQDFPMEHQAHNSDAESRSVPEVSGEELGSEMAVDNSVSVAESKTEQQASDMSNGEPEHRSPEVNGQASPEQPTVTSQEKNADAPSSIILPSVSDVGPADLASTTQMEDQNSMTEAAVVHSPEDGQEQLPNAPRAIPAAIVASPRPEASLEENIISEESVKQQDAEMDIDPPQQISEPATHDVIPQPPQGPNPSQENPTPTSAPPAKGSQEATILELKAKRASLLTALGNLESVQEMIQEDYEAASNVSELSEFHEPTDAEIMKAANKIVQKHIKLLHEYNEMKDVGQGLMGLIADARGVRIAEIQEEFGIGEKD